MPELARAMLFDAARVMAGTGFQKDAGRVREETEEWIRRGVSVDGGLGFDDLCWVVGVEPDYLRDFLLRDGLKLKRFVFSRETGPPKRACGDQI